MNEFQIADSGRVATRYALAAIRDDIRHRETTHAAALLALAALADEACLSTDGYNGTPIKVLYRTLLADADIAAEHDIQAAVRNLIGDGILDGTEDRPRIPGRAYNRPDAPTQPQPLPYSQER